MKEEQKGELILYQAEDETTRIEVRLENENIWLTQAQLVELYQSSKSNISEHIKHIFEEGELSEKLVVRKFRTTTKHGAIEGKTQENWANFYNLDMIISLGYRIKSHIATKFRIWATARLKEYMIKDGEFKASEKRHIQSGVLDAMTIAVEQIGIKRGVSPNLGWSHYRALMNVEHQADYSA
jgi:hypothetical protein